MKKFFAIMTALFVMGISFFYPITANAVSYQAGEGYHITDFADYNNENYGYYIYFNFTAEDCSKAFLITITPETMEQLEVTQEGNLYKFDFTNCVKKYSWKEASMGTYSGTSGCSFVVLYVNTLTGGINAYDSSNEEVDLFVEGRATWSSHRNKYTPFRAYDMLTNEVTFQTNWQSPNALNVSVSFVPALSGQVDRSVTTSDGSTALRQKLIMNVINNSSFPIQYDMYIMKKNIVSVRGGYMDLDSDDASRISTATTRFDDDPAFIFYSDSWVYTHGMDSELSYWDNNTYKYNKSSRWHYLGSGSSVVQEFDFSQIHLNEGEEYTVYVRAVRNDYDIASEKIVYLASSDPAYPELKQIQGDDIETVYSSDFSMIQYNDVVYDPNNSMNGVKPYDGQNGIYDRERYAWSRNASEDDNGNIDYSSVNHLDNKNSWINQQYGGVVNNHNKLVSGSLSFSSLNSIISPVVLFVSSTFTFLPDPLQLSFYLGFFAIVVLAVIKKVFA